MFDARTTADDQPTETLVALPHAAARCLRARELAREAR